MIGSKFTVLIGQNGATLAGADTDGFGRAGGYSCKALIGQGKSRPTESAGTVRAGGAERASPRSALCMRGSRLEMALGSAVKFEPS